MRQVVGEVPTKVPTVDDFVFLVSHSHATPQLMTAPRRHIRMPVTLAALSFLTEHFHFQILSEFASLIFLWPHAS